MEGPTSISSERRQDGARVALFVTCLVNVMRPSIGFAAARVLADAGCDVVVPAAQTCCGQPSLNSGDLAGAQAQAKRTIALLEGYDAVIVPSGSCAGTLRTHYPEILHKDARWSDRAWALAARTWEILAYLDEVLGWRPAAVELDASAAYHDACSGLRELGIKHQPRRLLAAVEGLRMVPLMGEDVCCGFGGTFCVKYPAISNAIVTEKAQAVEASGADLVLSGDLGCLMNIAGTLHRRGVDVRAFHTIEVLAGMANGPAIGEDA